MHKGFTIHHQCPQCGAPVTLGESQRIISCDYCRVRMMLTSSGGFTYFLPPKHPEQDLLYAPYLRFKGLAFNCFGTTVSSHVIDRNITALETAPFPYSLGMRPQAIPLHIITPEVTSVFIKPERKRSEMLEAMQQGMPSKRYGFNRGFHFTEYIGETESLIYSPFIQRNSRLIDALTNRAVVNSGEEKDYTAADVTAKHTPGTIRFIPTLCPQCGWDMEGGRDSCVMLCPNCCSAWSPHRDTFRRIGYEIYPHEHEKEVSYIPFWKIQAGVRELDLETYGDLIRFSCLPKVVSGTEATKPLHFWCPAFKIRPRVFMRLSRQLTATQPEEPTDAEQQGKSFLPVTLPASEAAQAVRVTLSALATKKQKIYPLLSGAHIDSGEQKLVFIPFSLQGGYFVSRRLKTSISRAAMDMGKNI